MSQLVKTLFAVFFGLIVALPALGLVCGVLIITAGLAASPSLTSIVRGVGLALAALIGIGGGLFGGLWVAHFHHMTLRFRTHHETRRIRVRVDLTGRAIYHHLWAQAQVRRSQGTPWVTAWEGAVDAYFEDDLRDYLLQQVRAQHGVAVADAMHLADEQAYYVSL
ncbi:hypothetical protein [Lacticaseibacillus daqingensis]|uniref:hypothetical protein n=1 Tax=Lacticaseibacillus daqingensis TaxID=2486014 RepID=UPI000F771D77|nr:hypothetical protein [Lacticaseibacillus daqingensis]